MPTISGPLSVVTDDPAVVTAVWVQAPALRTHGAGAILPQRAAATLTGSTVSFPCAPGPAVLIWQAGGVEDQVPILVDDGQSQTLAEVVSAAQLASGRTQDELAALVRQVTEGVAAVTAAASSASWSGDRLTVLGVTSPPLTGEPGAVPVIGEDGTWWVDGVDTGVKAQGPPGAAGDGAGDVLWSELNPVLDGKAPASHTHDIDQITVYGGTLDVVLNVLFGEFSEIYPRIDTVETRIDTVETRIDTVDARIDTRKGVIHSGTGPPPSSIPGAVVGDYWLNEADMSLHKITSL